MFRHPRRHARCHPCPTYKSVDRNRKKQQIPQEGPIPTRKVQVFSSAWTDIAEEPAIDNQVEKHGDEQEVQQESQRPDPWYKTQATI
jgi:hypothetical protein